MLGTEPGVAMNEILGDLGDSGRDLYASSQWKEECGERHFVSSQGPTGPGVQAKAEAEEMGTWD